MHERIRQMISAYLKNPPDPTLETLEYYYLQHTSNGDRAIRVFALNCFPGEDGDEYELYQRKGTRLQRINVGYDDPYRGVRMCELYDNRQDCICQTHAMYDGWPRLRAAQQREEERNA